MNFVREQRQIERLTKEGLREFASNDFESALRAFERVLALDDDNPVANTIGAAALLNLGRVDEAEPLARKGVLLTPELALAHYYLFVVLIEKQSYEQAESEIWEAVALQPNDQGMRTALGRFLFIRERNEEAIIQLSLADRLSPESAETHFLLGLSLLRVGRFREAREELERTVSLQPENDAALAFDGLLVMARADDLLATPPKLSGYRHASRLLRRALEINPDNELAVEYLQHAEEAIERIGRPSEVSKRPETWYQTLLKQLLVWVGFAAAAIAMFAVMAWLDESIGVQGFWYGTLFVSVFYLLAFGLMLYLRRDFSALPPSVVGFVERVSKQDISPVEPRVES